MSISTAYDKGVQARMQGQSIEDNPYDESWADVFAVPYSKHDAWVKGYQGEESEMVVE